MTDEPALETDEQCRAFLLNLKKPAFFDNDNESEPEIANLDNSEIERDKCAMQVAPTELPTRVGEFYDRRGRLKRGPTRAT